MSDLMLDAHRALSMTDEDERIRILREIERISSKILVVIGVDLDSCAPWYGAADAPDMRYTPHHMFHIYHHRIFHRCHLYTLHRYLHLLIHRW